MRYDKGNIALGISPKFHTCSSIKQSPEELIVVPSSSSQSGDFNQLSQDNPEDKQKSHILLSQSNSFNSPSS